MLTIEIQKRGSLVNMLCKRGPFETKKNTEEVKITDSVL